MPNRQTGVNKRTVILSEIKLNTEQHAEFSDIGFVQVREAVNEIYPEKFKNIFNTVAQFNIRHATGEKADSQEFLPIGLLGDQRLVHAAHPSEDDV